MASTPNRQRQQAHKARKAKARNEEKGRFNSFDRKQVVRKRRYPSFSDDLSLAALFALHGFGSGGHRP